MQELAKEAHAFSEKNTEAIADAQQRVALQILCGINFDEALAASGDQHAALMQRLERALKVERLKGLKRHIMTHYSLTPEQYREKWGLDANYPMVAPNYAAARSQLAKKMGLGRKRKSRSRS